MKFTKDDVGMKVYSLKYGEGRIRSFFSGRIYPLEVQFTFDYVEYFDIMGRLFLRDITQDLYYAKPEIIAPRRPKKKVKRIIVRFVNIFTDNRTSLGYKTLEEADFQAKKLGILDERIDCIKLTERYEVEE